MKCQMKIVVSGIGQGDRLGERSVGIVAGETYPRRVKVGLHGVSYQVHIVFFASQSVDVRIELLDGRAEE